MSLPEKVRGDGPCMDCGTADNIVWFTDDVLWNHVLRVTNDGITGGLLCPTCFVARTAASGLAPNRWRILPEFPWREVTHDSP